MELTVDVVVVGSGAGGLATAVVAAKLGLDVVLLESAPWFGGTTAYSGGAAWIPCNRHMTALGLGDSRAEAETYLREMLGDHFEQDKMDAFLDQGTAMLDFLEQHSELKLVASDFPDYETLPGAKCGRTLFTADFDARRLGELRTRLRPPRRDTLLFHSLQLSMFDPLMLKQAHKSWPAFIYSMKLFGGYLRDRLRYGRGARLCNGNALIARLLYSAQQAGVKLWSQAPATRLLTADGGVTGVVAVKDGEDIQLRARRGVMLASGGFGANAEMRARYVPHAAYGLNLQPESCRGDGLRMGLEAGGTLVENNIANGIWQIISPFARDDASWDVAIYALDRLSPGSLFVDAATGKRFVNEATNYHNFVRVMHEQGIKRCWMISEAPAARKYGIGVAKPWPFPIAHWIRKGYLKTAPSIATLAERIGVEAHTLNATVARFNEYADMGEDPDFHRGEDAYSRYLGDREHRPNPSLGALHTPPFYAVEFRPGETSTLVGLHTNASAQVLDRHGAPIPGLYAAGLDNNTLMRGSYPGGGCSIGPAMTFGYIASRRMAGVESSSPGH